MPSELYPVTMRATGHRISAGVGKLGAFTGVLFPLLQTSLGLRGTLLLTAGVALLGFALTLVLIATRSGRLRISCGLMVMSSRLRPVGSGTQHVSA